MSVFNNRPIDGVIPATLLAFDDAFMIDEAASRRHLAHVAATPGLSAVTVNGHASEVHACTFDEQQHILEMSLDEAGDKLPMINGIYSDSSLEAARLARMAEAAGASALLVFPPNSMIMGGQLRPEMTLTHFKTIADATDLPMIAFQYPQVSGLGYPYDTLLRLIEAVPSIKAIKDWSNDAMLHEKHIRSLQGGEAGRAITVLTTHSSWLMASLSMGANGLLSGAGSVIPELQVALFNAVKNGDLPGAQAINDRIYPLAQALYTPPFLDMHNRMKECLVLLGRQERAVVRPPLIKLHDDEIRRLRQALDAAGLLTGEAVAAE
ncbi:MAG: dihydrodipicolinate synthase family protein [Rhodospirillaceae bacterium]|jgi:4-hydroxy-tetrahydrodipicolinate synthase|nr:dihydrodipicolinate synthase family protein [Rhodospirillaceae bacterium]MBT4046107.1 dihydrodipicolinate synthase family protein [Rhodospirillaceae bacterium]MBT4687852.1 dihydrodipicolinate synthase family protein [Rhodospirillaceae bacterium]MBT5080246.1 dihydrodipicolinate synthase family protein [Rhodospirillaceae bacterium]MBT5527055.1 dihydrodipicolinate synthase family protein [Rhodospirillaceae bacterium]